MPSEVGPTGEPVRPADKNTICPGRPRPRPEPRGTTRFVVPPGAVDCHAYVVGAGLVDERNYTPPAAWVTEYLEVLAAERMAYGVLVQVSSHGSDNS